MHGLKIVTTIEELTKKSKRIKRKIKYDCYNIEEVLTLLIECQLIIFKIINRKDNKEVT